MPGLDRSTCINVAVSTKCRLREASRRRAKPDITRTFGYLEAKRSLYFARRVIAASHRRWPVVESW